MSKNLVLSSYHTPISKNKNLELNAKSSIIYLSAKKIELPLSPNAQMKNIKPSSLNRYHSQKNLFKTEITQSTYIDGKFYEDNLDYGIYGRDNRMQQKKRSLNNNNKLSQLKQICKLKDSTSTASQDIQFKCKRKASLKVIPEFLRNRFKQTTRLLSSLPNFRDQETNKHTISNYTIIYKLGQGKFGKVYLIMDKKTGFILALKVLKKKKILESGLIDQFIRQIKTQSYLTHPNIIKIFGLFNDKQNIYLLLECGCGGQLYSLMNKKQFQQQDVSYITKNLLETINYIHKEKILHRDIKPENIVLIYGTVKLCDFGWAVNNKKKEDMRSTFCGTPLYLSPQLLIGSMYDEKVDLWALGILIYQLRFHKSPFNIEKQQEMHKIVTGNINFPKNKQISTQFRNFMQLILKKNPIQRLTGEELLQQKFIKKYRYLQICQKLNG